MEPKQLLREHVAKTAMLSDDQFDYFYSFFKPQSYKKGQVIITEGDNVQHEYFVIGGCLKSFYMNDDVKMFILQFAMSTWWISDYNALMNSTKATLNVDCITDAQVLCLERSDREKLCTEIHQVERFFRLRTNRGYVALQKRILSLLSNDAKHRYEELISHYPELYNLVPKQLIAAYLGVSRETLSRLYHP